MKIIFTFLVMTIMGLESLYANFNIDTVDSITIGAQQTVSEQNSIVDSIGKIHVVYYKNNVLYYATNKSGSWAIEQIDSYQSYANTNIGIALDSHDNVHICYNHFGIGAYYATNKSGSWSVENFFFDYGYYAFSSSIALDSSDNVYIAFNSSSACIIYCSPAPDSLLFATNKSGSWVTETVEVALAEHISLDIDDNSKAHISYYSNSGDLKYATNQNPSWLIETVDSAGDVGKYTSVVVGNNQDVYIGYLDDNNHIIKMATKSGNIWSTETVVNNATYPSLETDFNDKHYIAYFDTVQEDLVNTTNKTGAWLSETVDSNGSVGQFPSLSVDKNGYMHITYYDGDNDTLKYATNAPANAVVAVPLFGLPATLFLIGLFGLAGLSRFKHLS